MEIRVEAKGPTFEQRLADTVRDLRAAMRPLGVDVARAGETAIERGAPRFAGRRLGARASINAGGDQANVTFGAPPHQAGPWTILESGRRGGYLVQPRGRRALHFAGRFAMTARPAPAAGQRAWSRAGERLRRALDPVVRRDLDRALHA